MAAMRLRTETFEMTCCREELRNIGNRMAGIDLGNGYLPDRGRAAGQVAISINT
jgi:hypothetical protein